MSSPLPRETEVRTLPADFGWRLAIRLAFQAAVREPTEAGVENRGGCVGLRDLTAIVPRGVSYGGIVRMGAESFRGLSGARGGAERFGSYPVALLRFGKISPMRRISAPTARNFSSMFS